MDSIPLKRCNECLKEFPATTEYFRSRSAKTRPMGLRGVCKQCMHNAYALKHPPVEVFPPGYKRCSICKELKPTTLEYFYAAVKNKDGLQARCKACCQRDYHGDSHDSIALSQKQYYANHRVERLAYYYQHRETALQGMRQWYERTGKVTTFPRTRRYRLVHRDHVNMLNRNRYVRKMAIAGVHTSEQIQEQLKRQHYRCYYAACGHAKFVKVKGKYIYAVEHTYPLSRVVGTDIPANDMSYLVLSCPSCNSKKRNKFPWEWPEGGRLL